jgi:hypothetical protein
VNYDLSPYPDEHKMCSKMQGHQLKNQPSTCSVILSKHFIHWLLQDLAGSPAYSNISRITERDCFNSIDDDDYGLIDAGYRSLLVLESFAASSFNLQTRMETRSAIDPAKNFAIFE